MRDQDHWSVGIVAIGLRRREHGESPSARRPPAGAASRLLHQIGEESGPDTGPSTCFASWDPVPPVTACTLSRAIEAHRTDYTHHPRRGRPPEP